MNPHSTHLDQVGRVAAALGRIGLAPILGDAEDIAFLKGRKPA